MIIEEMVAADYTRSSQQDNHKIKRLVEYEKEKNKHLENIYQVQKDFSTDVIVYAIHSL